MKRWLYDIDLNSKTIVNQSNKTFATREEAKKDAEKIIAMKLVNEYAAEPDDFEIIVYFYEEEEELKWIIYEDQSGHMEYRGKKFFSFDCTTYPLGVEYQKFCKGGWDVFSGDFKEFQKMAEKYVKESEWRNNNL